MKRIVLLGVSLLVAACDNDGAGRLRANLLLPPVSGANAAAYRPAAYDTGRALDIVRVTVLDGETAVATQEAPITARGLDILSLPAGRYTVRAEALKAGVAELAGRAEDVEVVTGKITETGDIRLAPVTPAAPGVRALPAFVNTPELQIRGTKEMFTGIQANGEPLVGVDDSAAFTAALRLREGSNALKLAAVNPDGVAGAPFAATVTLDTMAPKGAISIMRGVAVVASPAVSVELAADGASQMRVGEQADLSRSAWVSFAPSIAYTLSAGDGLKTLYAQFRDRAGNESAVVSDTVSLKTATAGPQLSVTPADAVNGTVLTVSGMAFGVSQGTGQVVLGGAVLTVQSWSDTQLVLLVGPTVQPGPGQLVVYVNEVARPALAVNVYPTIASRTPQSGANGDNFTITGANLGAAAGARDGVFFGASKAGDIITWSDTLIQGVVPFEVPATGTSLTVVAGGLASPATTFTGTRPWIEDRRPRAIGGGELFSLYGRNFGVSGIVYFNGLSATPVTWTATRIDAIVPGAEPAGEASVQVMVAGTQVSNKVSILVRGSGVWVPLEDEPSGRGLVTGVWTGTEMLVWGGAVYSVATNDAVESGAGHRYNPATDSWLPMSVTGAPAGRRNQTAVWTGKEMIVYGGTSANQYFEATGGRYNPFTDSWMPIGAGDSGRTQHSAVWTGTEMIVFSGDYDITGGRYNPVSDTWVTTSTAHGLSDRSMHTAVWTGREMIVWGGVSAASVWQNDGARYNPDTNAWIPLPSAGAPAARYDHTAVWTGEEMIVFGGCCTVPPGGAYNPRSDTWRAIATANAPSDRWEHSAVWTGNEMIVLGGSISGDGGRYNPLTDTWMPTAVTGAPARSDATMVWTGKEVLFWGGYSPGGESSHGTGSRYNPQADSWTPMAGPAANLPAARGDHAAVWTGSEMIVWGGYAGTVDGTMYNSGGRYNPTTDTWLPTSTGANVPSPRSTPATLWTGAEWIVWGGIDLTGPLNDGARYNPAADAWTTMNNAFAPVARRDYATTAAGSKLFVWGGWDGTAAFFWDGGVYDPAIDDWNPTTTGTDVLSGRKGASAVWTGSKAIVWGGWNDAQFDMNDGAAYDLTADTWVALPVTNAPSARHGHYAVWNGAKMFVFSGSAAQNSGAAYDPAAGLWSAIAPMVTADVGSSVVAVGGGDVFVFGGSGSNGGSKIGYLYGAGTDTWAALPAGDVAPFGRANASAIWTGSEVILWGGFYDHARSAWPDGARYLP